MNIAEILNKHVGEDGILNVAEAEKELKAGIAGDFVPKHDFNSKNDQLKDANSTIAKLQKDNKDNEALQTEIAEQKARADKAEIDLSSYQIRKEAEDALRDKGVTNVDYALFKMGDLERDSDGKLKDFDAKYTEFATANPDFIKKDESADKPAVTKPSFYGAKPAAPDNSGSAESLSFGARMGRLAAENLGGNKTNEN